MFDTNLKAMLLATTVLMTVSAPLVAHAAAETEPTSTLDEIVVTATKTGATQVQSTPLSVAVLSGGSLEQSGAANVKDLVQLTPNLNVAAVTTNAVIYIRGIGSNNVFNGSDPDVTVEVDGVYLARAYAQFTDFIDVDRVEVLRGPQGTLYGRNAVGGVLNIISRTPTDDFHGKAQLTFGDYGMWQEQAYISGALVPGKVQASLSANYIKHSGYYENIVPGVHDVGDANHGGVRGQVRMELSDRLTATTRADYTHLSEYGESYDHLLVARAYAPLASSIVGDYSKVALNEVQKTDQTIKGVSEEIDYRLTDQLGLKSITAYRVGEYDLSNDTDATEVRINLGTQADKSKQFSQEFTVTANLDKFDAVAGVYYFHEDEDSRITSLIPPSPAVPSFAASFNDVQPHATAESRAVFAQGTYHLTPTLRLTAGARYTADRKHLDQDFARYSEATYPVMGGPIPGFPFVASVTRDFHAFTPKFGVDWQASDNIFAYASATKGYKSGGTNYAATNVAALSFEPEQIWSYEAGVRTEWFDRRLRINATAFDYDYTNLQVQSLIGPGLVSIGNAASAKVKGFELETTAKPTPEWLFSANLALLDAKYESFPKASVPGALAPYLVGDPDYSPGPPATYNATGNYLNAAPKTSFSLAAQYTHEFPIGEIYGRAEYYWQDRVFYDASNSPLMSQPAYGLLNLSAGWRSRDDGWGVQLIARNVTNEQYLITVAANGVAPAGLAGAPRTVQLRISRSW